MITKLVDEEGLNIINKSDPTHAFFATRTQTAIDVAMFTPELNIEVEWHVQWHVQPSANL
jgi:hypothetical protein